MYLGDCQTSLGQIWGKEDNGKVLSVEYPQYTSLPYLITLTIITENNNKCKIWLYSILNGLHVKYIFIITQKNQFSTKITLG